ncbi:MAG: hypothetical protein ACE5EQ_01040 [Phycisphaerae bacterium]
MAEERTWVLDVGNCDPDHGMIRRMLTEHFDVEIDRVMFVDEALDRMRSKPYALVLVNRLIFRDGSEGIALVRQAKAETALSKTPIMLISNFAKVQDAAVAEGAERGFGKDALFQAETSKRLSAFLPGK